MIVATSPTTHITPEMRSAIGREISRKTSFPISASDVRKWAIAVYYPNEPPAMFWRGHSTQGVVSNEMPVPEDFNPFAWISAEPPGLPTTSVGGSIEAILGLTPPNLSFVLNGGMECEYGARMHPHDVVSSVVRLRSYRERQGRLGLMLFSTTEDTWTNQNGEVLKRVRQTQIRY
jgi:hypothetical protein